MDPSPIKMRPKITDVNSPEYRFKETKRRAYDLWYREMRSIWRSIAHSKEKSVFINYIVKRFTELIPEAAQDIEKEFDVLNTFDEKDEENLLNKAVDIMIQIMARYLSLEELERRLQARQIKELGQQKLSRVLNFEIIYDRVHLHTPVAFFKDPSSAVQSYVEGLKVLAHKIATEKELKDIVEVVRFSPLIKEKYRLWTRLGFEVIREKDGKPTEEAKMSREKILEMYGK